MRRQKVDILITDAGDRIIVPTAKESQAIDEQIASDQDDFELDDAWFEGARPPRSSSQRPTNRRCDRMRP